MTPRSEDTRNTRTLLSFRHQNRAFSTTFTFLGVRFSLGGVTVIGLGRELGFGKGKGGS